MKKILFLAVAISIGFAACKKGDEAEPQKVKIEKKVLDGEEGGGDTKNDGGWD